MTAVFAMADARGVSRPALGEWLAGIEAVAIREMNEAIKDRMNG